MAEKLFRKGDWVSFTFGLRTVQGQIKEDRGPIGVKGRRLYLIEFRAEPQAPSVSYVELPADEFQEMKELTPLK